MIRIVGIQRSNRPESEFVLLQNQGGMRLQLRGHLLLCEAAIDDSTGLGGFHAFVDAEFVPPGCFVLVRTGSGTPGWYRQKDGMLVYHAYMGRRNAWWPEENGQLHILATQHTFAERREPLLAIG